MKNKIVIVIICFLMIFITFSSYTYGYNISRISSNLFQKPVVEITSPEDGATVSDPLVIVEGNAFSEIPMNEYGYTILYPGGGIYSEFWILDPPVEYHDFSIDITIVEGSDGNEITVYFKDLEGQKGEDKVTIIYETATDTEPPEVVIQNPEESTIYPYPQVIGLAGQVTDNVGVVLIGYKHQWSAGNFDSGYIEIPGGPVQNYEFYFDVSIYPGRNDITVYSVDEAENEGEDEVNVTVQEECTNRTPIITDNSGNTTFHSVIVGCDHRNTPSELRGCQQGAEIMQSTLQQHPGWSYERMSLLYEPRATRDAVSNAIEEAKARAQPGDEFLFYFADHGGNSTIEDSNISPDEPDGHDEHIALTDGRVSDDELAEWLSGFRDCVTITVKLDCCHSGGFVDGDSDLQNATNAEGEPYGPDHINIEAACRQNETISERPYFWNDSNDDWIISPDELREPDDTIWNDLNGNGRYDRDFDSINYWIDLNGNGEREDNEILSQFNSRIKYLSDFLISNLEALSNTSILKNPSTTRADRNKDGITTTKELYEFSINYLCEWLGEDEDNDGELNEDGYEFEENVNYIKRLYIDNDGDGYFDEDPAPPSFAFWYDQNPQKPTIPEGKDQGKPGEIYSYSTSSIDPDGDDLFYLWDFGDGKNSDWLGPYKSGVMCSVDHSWDEEGNYDTKVKTRDRCYAESSWSDPLSVSMQKNKEKIIDFPFIKSIKDYHLLYKLITQLLIFIVN